MERRGDRMCSEQALTPCIITVIGAVQSGGLRKWRNWQTHQT